MESEDEHCRVCNDVLSKKQRRLIFSQSFNVMSQLIEVVGYIPSTTDKLSTYICFKCFNKLNRLSKIDYDLKNKLDLLKKDKRDIIGELRKNIKVPTRTLPKSPPQATNIHVHTPKDQPALVLSPLAKTTSKRQILHTPTPRKTKKPNVCTTPRPAMPKARKRLAEKLLSPMKAKVLILTMFSL